MAFNMELSLTAPTHLFDRLILLLCLSCGWQVFGAVVAKREHWIAGRHGFPHLCKGICVRHWFCFV
jgi:hypothetical protein